MSSPTPSSSGDAMIIFDCFAVSQDKIGWRRFIEGMISKECAEIHQKPQKV